MSVLFELFWRFFQTGLFAVGGGLATLPFLNEISEATGWYTKPQLADMIAISESTPGPIGVNMSTYVGYHAAGIPGALLATFSLALPSVLIIFLVYGFLERFKGNQTVDAAFYGLRAASVGLIAAAGIGVVNLTLLSPAAWKASGALTDLFNWKGLLLAAVLLLATRKLKWHPIVFLAASAVIGIVFHFGGV
ncbi:chromate transporter [Lacrimispora sp. NSJ-141]|uniref:Chromate transporter n=1 Tax=Lientehia hominis TaxID=2897778 RepID=A0AAP2RJL8_9FIRM|nr:chromate transporter [Lientehia hominis]MCD2492860.1 chromate transporter [Lientehia hominis]